MDEEEGAIPPGGGGGNGGNDGGGYGDPFDFAQMVAGGAGSALGGIVDIFAGRAAKREANKELGLANQNLEKVLGNQPSLATPGEYYEAVKNAYDQRLLQMRTDDINRSLATTAGAAQQYGSRGLGAIMGAQAQAQRQMREEALNQQQLQTQALTNLAGAREREIELREARSNRDIEYGYDAKALAEARRAQAQQQLAQGFGSLVGGLAQVGVGAAFLPKKPGEGGEGGGGKFETGGRVQKTPGKFSHEENEMYVVDAQGKSMGLALTGGEYVIDPARANRLKKKVKDPSLKGMKVLRKEVQTMISDFEKAD